jgi:hypothetical protein
MKIRLTLVTAFAAISSFAAAGTTAGPIRFSLVDSNGTVVGTPIDVQPGFGSAVDGSQPHTTIVDFNGVADGTYSAVAQAYDSTLAIALGDPATLTAIVVSSVAVPPTEPQFELPSTLSAQVLADDPVTA